MAPNETQQATQPATQPYEDPRRQGRTLSDMSGNEASDIICVLHSSSPRAVSAVRATMLQNPEHILQNDDLDGLTEDDLLLDPKYDSETREIALRMSSTVKLPKDGFRFGRNPQSCDVLLSENSRDKLISNTHFRIFVHEQGSLMIQDMSTNGTIVDDDLIRAKDKFGHPLPKPGKRVLSNGSTITVLAGADKSEIKFIVRIPNRTDYETLYEQKLRRYLEVRGVTANFSSVRESSFGNFWTGGTAYNFTGLLGKGAFASVYRIQTKSEGTIYAAKEIDKRRFVKNGLLDVKFDNELKIMRRLKHPNIVEYIDCQSYKNWIYIIMEYVPHGELSKELASRGQLPEPEVQQITKQTLRALDYLHRQGVTHRDIKPDNILIAQREPLLVKLSDFGLSKSVVDQETFLKTFCGTLLYCAPEVYPDYGTYTSNPAVKRRRHGDSSTRTSPYDSSADMWSFGAVVFHLLCGRAPITGRGENGGAQMLNNIMTKDVDFSPLRELSISEDAVDFISALLNRHPHMRPKEAECFQHPWLRSVPDVADYGNVTHADDLVQGQLHDVEELDEDEGDDELMDDLNRLTQGVPAQTSSSTPSSPERALKKPRMQRAESTIPEQILYPMLPPGTQGDEAVPKTPGEPRLFGEITESVLKSSGIFGVTAADSKSPEIPRIQEQLELVSMNDFANKADSNGNTNVVSNQQLQHAQALGIPTVTVGSAASLLGAEAQMGHMNMGSPDMPGSDAPTPDTTNPITPQTRELSPDKSTNKVQEESKVDEKEPTDSSSDGPADRRISVHLLSDEAAFAEEQRARQEARLINAQKKAETFHHSHVSPPRTAMTTMVAPLAQTFHGATHPVEDFDHAGSLWSRSRVVSLNRQDEQNIAAQPLLGLLKPLPGSFSQETIRLMSRSTLWGRGEGCNCRYHDLKDTRVPKFGLKVIFFSHGIEQIESQGLDWTQVPDIRTIVATSATRGIQINGIHLAQQSPDGGAALFGKIYTGDIITVVDSDRPGEFLKYEVEITFGGSAQRRPEGEQPFSIQKEYKYHAQMKSHSQYGGMVEDTMMQKRDLIASNVVSVN